MNKKKSVLTLIVILVVVLCGLGFAGYKYYNYLIEKNTSDNLVLSFDTNIKTDISSYVGLFNVSRDGELVSLFNKQDAMVFCNAISQTCSEYITADPAYIVSNIDNILSSASNVVSAQLGNMTLELTDEESTEFTSAISCICCADIYKTLLSAETLTSDTNAVFESYLTSYFNYFVGNCIQKQDELGSSVGEICTLVKEACSAKNDFKNTSEVAGLLDSLVYVDTFLNVYNNDSVQVDYSVTTDTTNTTPTPTAIVTPAVTSGVEPTPAEETFSKKTPSSDALTVSDSIPSTPVPTIEPTPIPNGYKELLKLSNDETAYLKGRLATVRTFLEKNRSLLSDDGIDAGGYISLIKESEELLSASKTLTYTQLNELQIITPTLKSDYIDSIDKNSLVLGDVVLKIENYCVQANESMAHILCNQNNLVNLIKSVRFGLGADYWGNENIIAICNNALSAIGIPSIISNFEIKEELMRVESLLEELKVGNEGTNDSKYYNSLIDCLNTLISIKTNKKDLFTLDDLSSLKSVMITLKTLENDNAIGIRELCDDITSSCNTYSESLKLLDVTKKKAEKKKLNKAISAEDEIIGSVLPKICVTLVDTIASLTCEQNAGDNSSLAPVQASLEIVFARLSDLLNKFENGDSLLREYMDKTGGELSESLSSIIEKTVSIESDIEKVEGVLNRLDVAIEKIPANQNALKYITKDTNVGLCMDDVRSSCDYIRNLINENTDLLERTDINKVNGSVTMLIESLNEVDRESVEIDSESKTLDEDVSAIRTSLEPSVNALGDLRDCLENTVVKSVSMKLDELNDTLAELEKEKSSLVSNSLDNDTERVYED